MDAPLNVIATPSSQCTPCIDLSWSAVAGATQYVVYRSDTLNGTYTTFATVSSTSYTDSAIAYNRTYYYKIAGRSSTEVGYSSSAVSATVYQTLDLTVIPLDSSRLELTWNAIAGAGSYTIYRSTYNGGYQYIITVNGTEFTDTGLSPNTTYWYLVISDNGVEDVNSGTTLQDTLIVTVNTIDQQSLAVQWNAAAGATSYSVYRSTYNGGYTLIATTGQTAYIDTNLSPDTTYWYLVIANTGAEGIGAGATLPISRYTIEYLNLMGASNPNPPTYSPASLPLVLADPGPLPGARFIGWFDAPTGGNQVYTIPQGASGDITLYARWEAIAPSPPVVLCRASCFCRIAKVYCLS